MKMKIVVDSSANMRTCSEKNIVSVPLKITAGEKNFVDDETLDVKAMADYLAGYNGKSGSACPGTGEWIEAFGNADRVFAVTITSNLSGSYNSARVAAEEYMEEHPERKVYVVDSLSAGPELKLIVEKLEEMITGEMDFDSICKEIAKYQKKSFLIFNLKSLRNLANNGRVSPAVATLASIIGIHMVGKASEVGTLEPMDKVRGEKKAISSIYKNMKMMGYKGGKVRIDHCLNIAAAQKLEAVIREEYPSADVVIDECRGLCCFYAEVGGLMIGAES